MSTPLISIVIPVYNAKQYIATTLTSVLSQTYSCLEIIVVDDGSTDGTADLICSEFNDSRIQIVSQPNQGVARARNNGFLHAKGQYVAFLDADDRWFPTKLEVDIQTLARHEDKVCLIYSGVYCVDPNNRLTSIRKFIQNPESAFKTILTNNLMIPSSTLMHRDVVEKMGGFPIDSYHEDRVFFVKACRYFPAYATGHRLVVYQEALSGRLRRILMDYDTAVSAELSVIESLRSELAPEELTELESFHRRSIFNRFLRYNLLSSAKRYANQLPENALNRDLKGLISKLSLATNVNFLYICQIIIYLVNGVILQPWWFIKSRSLVQANA